MGCQSNNKQSTAVRSVFLSGEDVYAAGNVCAGTSVTDEPTLWKNGVSQEIGNMGNFNHATSVFVSDDIVYATISESESNKAILWKNGALQILGDGEANDVFVAGNNVYVVGDLGDAPVLWKNGKVERLGGIGSAESVFVNGKDVYVAGYVGSYFVAEAVVWKNGEIDYLGNGRANSVFVADNGDVYVAGSMNNRATYWKNGVQQYLWDIGQSEACSIAVTDDGRVYVVGVGFDEQMKSIAVAWIDGKNYRLNEKMGYQANSVVADGNSVYFGGCSKDGIWSVWYYDGKSDFSSNNLIRVTKRI